VYDGTSKSASGTTAPVGLAVTFTYNGNPDGPINPGSYTVIGTVADNNYAGAATNELVIAKAGTAVTLASLSHLYDGTARSASATTAPVGLAVTFTYNGNPDRPTDAGSYTVIGAVDEANYVGSATNTLTVTQAVLTVTADNQSKVFGEANPPLTGTLVGIQKVENITATYTTLADANSPVGGHVIEPVRHDPDTRLGNYTVTTNNGTLTIVSATVLLSVSEAPEGTFIVE